MIDIPALKSELRSGGAKVTLTDLLALAPKNDPFGVFTPARITAAEWAAQVWHDMGEPRDLHIRRMHYWLVSSDVQKPDGMAYKNTDHDWMWLCDAVKYARYRGLMPVDALIDQRNPDPVVHADYVADVCEIILPWTWYNPKVEINLNGIHNGVRDYAEHIAKNAVFDSEIEFNPQNAQPYHLEVWCEKSTMNDVLVPVCERYGANLVTALGQVSLTQCMELVNRACVANKPVRIFYISDFDPAGTSMPTAAARKIEWCVSQIEHNVDIQLRQIALTEDQCIEYQLPRTPIKDSDRAKSKFEERYGSGATELDALEALHPGELERIVSGVLEPFYDHDIAGELRTFESEIRDEIYNQVYDSIVDQSGSEIDTLFAEIREDAENIRQLVEPHTAALQEKVQKLNAMLSEIRIAAEVFTEPPRSELVAGGDGWLFDSKRDYLTQLERYRNT